LSKIKQKIQLLWGPNDTEIRFAGIGLVLCKTIVLVCHPLNTLCFGKVILKFLYLCIGMVQANVNVGHEVTPSLLLPPFLF
jgi:hypothetical protein